MARTTVLVTGATGFIAGHCIEEMLSHGYAVRGTVRNAATADVAHLSAIARRTQAQATAVASELWDQWIAHWGGGVPVDG